MSEDNLKNVRKVIIIATLSFFALPSLAEIQVKEDRFTKRTVIDTVPHSPEMDGQPSLTLLATLSKNKNTVGLLLYALSEKWRYLECHSVNWLVDGEPFSMPKVKHDGNIGSGYVLENLQFAPLTKQQIGRLVAAEKIEYKICNDEYQFGSTELEDLKKFYELLLVHKAWGVEKNGRIHKSTEEK